MRQRRSLQASELSLALHLLGRSAQESGRSPQGRHWMQAPQCLGLRGGWNLTLWGRRSTPGAGCRWADRWVAGAPMQLQSPVRAAHLHGHRLRLCLHVTKNSWEVWVLPKGVEFSSAKARGALTPRPGKKESLFEFEFVLFRRMLSPAECWRCSAVSALSWLSAWAATSSGRPLESAGTAPARVALCWSATGTHEAFSAALLEAAAHDVLRAAAPAVEAVDPALPGCSECPALGSGLRFGSAVLWPFPLASTLL